LRHLPAPARPGRLRRHRNRPGDREEDRRISWRADLAEPRRRAGHIHRLHPSGAPRRAGGGDRGRDRTEGGHRMTPASRADGTPIEVLLVEDDPGDVLMTPKAVDFEQVNTAIRQIDEFFVSVVKLPPRA